MATEHYRQSDGSFSIRAYTELNRHGNPQHRVRYSYRGNPPCTDTAKSEAEAVTTAKTLWKAHLDGLLDAPMADPLTIQELLDAFVKRPKLSPASVRSYEQACGRFVAFIGADRDLAAIGRGAVEKWTASLTCKDVSKATYLRSVSALFKWAKREKYIREDPTADVRIEQARAGHVIRPWMQSFEWPAFQLACGKSHRIRAEFVLHVGLRAGELIDTRWEWLHGTVGRLALSVPARKSARARAIPLDVRALELLDEAKAMWGDSGYIFGKDKPSQGNLRRDNVRACKKAGVTVCDFHGLRRSCGAHWLECGVDLLQVSRWLGHADVSTTARHYAGLSDASSSAAMDKVNAAIAAVLADEAAKGLPGNVVRLPVRRPAQK